MPFSATTNSWLAVLAVALGVVALGVALLALRRSVRAASGRRPRPRSGKQALQPLTTDEMTTELAGLQAAVGTALRHLAVVRYDAFGDMGGHMSWSMALVDDAGDGVVLTSIHGRSDSRTYAKNVTHWSASQQLSPEEEEAIAFARDAQ